MEKTRVPKGENYYWLGGLLEVCSSIEYYNSTGDAHYRCGNYFHSREEAESMARKLRAILKGADVIEMPSEKEWKQIANSLNDGFEDSQSSGIREAYNYLKSKIVK